jgi:dienelactone hydrolase
MATVRTLPFELRGADGGPLRGEARTGAAREGGPAVVICHGFKGFKDWGFFPHLAQRIARAGITAVTFNFSGSGVGPDGERFSEPERFARATFTGDAADLEQVVATLLAGALAPELAPPRGLGLFGHSRGGAAAILHAARHPNCRALVTWAAIADVMRWDQATIRRWRAEGKLEVVNTRTGEILPLHTNVLDDVEANRDRLDLTAAAARVAAPWLIVHGEADESVPVADAEILYGAARHDAMNLLKIRSGTHTFGARHPWGGSTRELDEAMDATVAWFSRHLW